MLASFSLIATLVLGLLHGQPEAGAPPGQRSGDPVDPMLVIVDRSGAWPGVGQAAVRRPGGAVVWTLPSGRVRVSSRLGPSSMCQPLLWILA